MSKIIFVPVERLEERYTGMVYDSLVPYVDKIIEPNWPHFQKGQEQHIKKGQFLDICGTINFKALQLSVIADMFDADEIKDGDVFLFGDIFFPGLESIKYMAELLGISVKIAAFNHAGRADETDFVRQLGTWSDHSERGWHEACDLILCGSEFHRKRVIAYFKQPAHKVVNTGMVWSPEWVEEVFSGEYPFHDDRKQPFVIWPHRLCFEKGVDILYRYALQTERRILITSCGKKDKEWEQFAGMENVDYRYGLSKADYYNLMSDAEFYLSTARQETFGYTLQEALHFGCKVLAPNHACYNEFLPIRNLYDSEADIDIIFDAMAAAPKKERGVMDNFALNNNVAVIMDAVKSLI